MTTTPLDPVVREEAGRAVIDLQGEINAAAEDSMNRAYAQAIALKPEAIVLNFSGVTYINSTGIALIVGVLARAKKEHLPVIVYGLTGHYLKIFQITRLADFMTIHDDASSALQDGKAEASAHNNNEGAEDGR